MIIVCKVADELTSVPAMATVLAVMNVLDPTYEVRLVHPRASAAGDDADAFAFFYLGYAYFYFYLLAGDT